jgi:hypothetical protein
MGGMPPMGAMPPQGGMGGMPDFGQLDPTVAAMLARNMRGR